MYSNIDWMKVFGLLSLGFSIGILASMAYDKRKEESGWPDDDFGIPYVVEDEDGYLTEMGELPSYSEWSGGDVTHESHVILPETSEKPDIWSVKYDEDVKSKPDLHEISNDEYMSGSWTKRMTMVYFSEDDILADAENDLEQIEPSEVHAEDFIGKLDANGAIWYAIDSRLEAYEILSSTGNYLEEYEALKGEEKDAYDDVIQMSGY